MKGRYIMGFCTIIQWLVTAIIVLLSLWANQPRLLVALILPGMFELGKIVVLFDFRNTKLD